MNKKCPKCESKDIHITHYPIPTDSMATCYSCGYADLLERFPEQTVFDYITQSEEKLAEKLVYEKAVKRRAFIYGEYGDVIGEQYVITNVWSSALTDDTYTNRVEAVAATLKELKKVVK